MPLKTTLSAVLLALLATGAGASPFDDAQTAAREGRYRDVIRILGDTLESEDLDAAARVVAYSNRGIAYSLLGAYELARADLNRAHALEPSHALTLNHLGILAEQVDGDHAAAAEWYRMAADAGFAASEVNLGNLYRDGLGVARDPKRALGLYERAASQQYVMAYLPLGEMYLSGQGTGRDARAGLEWIRRAADSGVVSAHFLLGQAHEKGEGVDRDAAEAARHYRVAALQGHGEAQNALGYLYRRGAGVGQDYLEAARWYRLAADQGIASAINRLAWLLATCPVPDVCNGAAALELAQQAVGLEASASHLDSLAAAYARVGDFDRAVETLEQVLRDLPVGGNRGSYERRLARYRNRVPHQL